MWRVLTWRDIANYYSPIPFIFGRKDALIKETRDAVAMNTDDLAFYHQVEKMPQKKEWVHLTIIIIKLRPCSCHYGHVESDDAWKKKKKKRYRIAQKLKKNCLKLIVVNLRMMSCHKQQALFMFSLVTVVSNDVLFEKNIDIVLL